MRRYRLTETTVNTQRAHCLNNHNSTAFSVVWACVNQRSIYCTLRLANHCQIETNARLFLLKMVTIGE